MADKTPIQKGYFKGRWMFPINRTSETLFYAMRDGNQFSKVADEFYDRTVRQFAWWRKIKPFIKRWIFFWAQPWEKAIFQDPIGKRLFNIFLEDIYGRKSGIRVSVDAKIRFLGFLFRLLDVKKNPAKEVAYGNYQETAFGLKMQRPGVYSHIHLSFPFIFRRLKKVIKQYVEFAVILGDYDILLKRYPPYHNLLSVFVPPGQRTLVDPRGLDVVIIYKLPFRYSLALGLDKVPTRSNMRTITCPIIKTKESVAEFDAEIEKLTNDLKGIFPSPAYLGNVAFENGEIVFNGKEGKDKVQAWGPRRLRFLQTEAELNQLKACTPASPKSGVIVRFNLLQPLAALINGINHKRQISLDELPYICQVLDMQMGNVHAPEEKRRQVGEIIDEVFSEKRPPFKPATKDFLSTIEHLRKEDPSENKAWDFIISHLLEGKYNALANAICFLLIADTFELTFSIWPLLTGREISINEETGEYEEREVTTRKKQKLPLIDCLQNELEDLLRNVFTRHVEISAATQRARSEPRLSQLIVEHCINVRSDPEKFRRDLQEHLIRHYETQRKFFNEYLQGVPPEALKTIYQPLLGDTLPVSEMVERDVAGIEDLVEESRRRLYSPTTSYRLLCYIDPESVEIQIGDFEYGGDGIEEEQRFFREHEKRQFELATIESNRRKEVEAKRIMIKGGKEMYDMDIKRFAVEEAVAQAEVEKQKRINDLRLEEFFGKAKLLAVEKLREGNMKEYAAYTLIQAHHDGGFDQVEKILADSPNILMSISPDLFKAQKSQEIKKKIVAVLEKDPKQINPLTAAALLNMDLKDVAQADILKEFNKSIMDIFQKMPGFGMGMAGRGGLINVNTSSEAECGENGKRADGTPCDEQGRRISQGHPGAGQGQQGMRQGGQDAIPEQTPPHRPHPGPPGQGPSGNSDPYGSGSSGGPMPGS